MIGFVNVLVGAKKFVKSKFKVYSNSVALLMWYYDVVVEIIRLEGSF